MFQTISRRSRADYRRYSILVIGPKGAGKTTFIQTFRKNVPIPVTVKMKDDNNNPIVNNIEPLLMLITVKDNDCDVAIYDFDTLPPPRYYSGLQSILYIYDISDPNCVLRLTNDMAEIQENVKKYQRNENENPILMIAANKIDNTVDTETKKAREQNVSQCSEIAKKYGATFTMTNGLNYEDVDLAFHILCREIEERFPKEEKDDSPIISIQKESQPQKKSCSIQ